MAFEKVNICVFGASSRDLEQAYVDAAYQLGTLMAQRGWTCLNGAGSEGLMRAVSDGTLDAGGEAIGVIPQFMVDNGWHYDRLSSIITTATMHERKLTLAQMSQAVIALPGGCGTMEELLEAITWRQLNIAPKPIVVLNTLGYYNHLAEMLNTAIEQGFMRKSHHRLFQVVDTPEQAIASIEKELSQEQSPIESKYKTEVRNQKSEIRNQKSETRNQKPEVRNQKSETRSQKSEVSGLTSDN